MSFSPDAWERLGILFQDARQRLGMSRAKFAEHAGISEKAVYNAESGEAHSRVPPTFAKYAAALDWTPESVRTVLAGGDPAVVGGVDVARPTPPRQPQTHPEEATLLDLLTRVHEFGRLAVSLGADGGIRDRLDATAQQLVRSIPRKAVAERKGYELAAYRPHAAGEGPAEDDAERILRAMEEDR